MTKPNSILLLAAALILTLAGKADAQELRYQLEQDKIVPYRVTITATTPTKVETMSGLIAFTGKGSEGENLRIEYKGGLTKKTKSKVSQSRGPFGGPFGGGPFGGRPGGGFPRGPFDQPNFRGLTTSTSAFVISNQGELETMRSDSQMPYLLGNVAMLPFEPLGEGKQSWEVGTNLTITSKEESSRFGPRFGPMARGNQEETKTGGGESSKYKISSDDGKLVTINKTYSLTSPAATSQDTGFEMKGSGTWVFNREMGMSESMDFKVDLNVKQENSSTKIPITVKWNRIPEQEYLDYLKEREEQRAAAIAKMNQPKAATKISDANKKKIMSKLTHSQWGVVWGELMSLSRSRMSGLVAEDMDLMVVVAGLRSHSNKQVKSGADKIWNKWKDSFEELASPQQKAEVAGTSDDANPFMVANEDDGRGLRQWSDKTGRFKIEAQFVEIDGANVVLESKDGKTIKVPKMRLAEADQALAEKLAK